MENGSCFLRIGAIVMLGSLTEAETRVEITWFIRFLSPGNQTCRARDGIRMRKLLVIGG